MIMNLQRTVIAAAATTALLLAAGAAWAQPDSATVQRARTRVGFAPVAALHGEETLALEGHVQVAAGALDGAGREVGFGQPCD